MAKKAKKAAKKPMMKAAAKKKAPMKKLAKKPMPKMISKAAKVDESLPKARTASKPKNSSTHSYTLSEFFENIRSFCGLKKRSEAKELCDDIALFIKDSLKKGYKVPLLGLGKMYVRHTKPRIGRNPATGEEIHIGAKKRVRFTAAKSLKEAVL